MFKKLLDEARADHEAWGDVPIDVRLQLCAEFGKDRLWEMFTEMDGGPEALQSICENLYARDHARAQSQNQLILGGCLVRYFGDAVRLQFDRAREAVTA